MRLSISQAKTTHTLEACLTADGRAYKIDGRIKTGTQVKVCVAACVWVRDVCATLICALFLCATEKWVGMADKQKSA